MDKIKYMYFGNQNDTTRNGVISIGYRFEGDKLLYSVAFCSKNDRFIKSVTHKIITGRMENKVNSMTVLHETNMNYKAVKLYIISTLKNYPSKFAQVNVPSWAGEIIKQL